MNILDDIQFKAQPIKQKFKPFQKWEGTSLKDYEVEFQIITVGDQIKLERALAQEPVLSLQHAMKVELIARSLKAINGQPVVSDDEFDDYKENNKTSDDFSRHDFIVLKLKQFSEQVINALYFTYEDLQNAYVQKLSGAPINNALNIKKQDTTPEANNPEEDSPDDKSSDAQGS